VTSTKNVMTNYAVGDPKEQLHNELLKIQGKAEELTDIICCLWHFLDIIIEKLGKPL